MPVNTALLKGIFNSLSYATEKIPDHWFDKVPGGYFKPKKDKKRKKEEKRSRRYSEADRRKYDDDDYDDDDDDDDAGYASDDYDNRRGRREQDDDYDDDNDYRSRARSHGRVRGQSVGVTRRDDRDRHYSGRSHEFGGDGTRFVAVR